MKLLGQWGIYPSKGHIVNHAPFPPTPHTFLHESSETYLNSTCLLRRKEGVYLSHSQSSLVIEAWEAPEGLD